MTRSPGTEAEEQASEVRMELAIQLAREAGAIQREYYASKISVRTKGESIDLVTEVDERCEAMIVAKLTQQHPGDAILAEEGGGRDFPDAQWRWIVDPLDGTTNYAHAYPRFCVSIGVELGGERQLGVVYDPLLDELFCAVRGKGATLNGKKLAVSSEAEIGNALLATGFAYDIRRTREDNIAEFTRFLKASRAVRRDGSAALDLCYVAAGRLDGFWEFKLHAWDVAAGLLIVEEAGGRCSNAAGGPPPRSGHETVASNGLLHESMLELLGRRPDGSDQSSGSNDSKGSATL